MSGFSPLGLPHSYRSLIMNDDRLRLIYYEQVKKMIYKFVHVIWIDIVSDNCCGEI